MFPVDAVDPEFDPDVLTVFDCPDPVADPNIELIPGIPLETHQGTLLATVLVSIIVVGVVASVKLLVNEDDTAVLISGATASVVVMYDTVVVLEPELETPPVSKDPVSDVPKFIPELVMEPELVSTSEVAFEDDPEPVGVIVTVLPELVPELDVDPNPDIVLDDDPFELPKLLPVLDIEIEVAPIGYVSLERPLVEIDTELVPDPVVEDDDVDPEPIPDTAVPLSILTAELFEVVAEEELVPVSDEAPVEVTAAVPEVEVPLFTFSNDPRTPPVLVDQEVKLVSWAGIKTWLGNPNVELDAKLAANTPPTNHQGFANSVVKTGLMLVPVCGLL